MDDTKMRNIEYLLNSFESKAIGAYSVAENSSEYDTMVEADKEKYTKALYILNTMTFGSVYGIDDFICMVECDLIKDEHGYGKFVDSDCVDMDYLGSVECNSECLEEAIERGAAFVKWYSK